MRYRHDDTLIDLAAREIRRAGAPVEVEAKAFDLIALLLAHRDRAVSKRDVCAALWDGRPVSDAALSQQLRKARRALGDDGDAQRVIRTVHGRGLRWVAAVEAEAGDSSGAQVAEPASNLPQEASTPARKATPVARLAGAVLVAALLLVAAIGTLRHIAAPPSAQSGNGRPRVAILPVDDRSGDPALAWARMGLMGLMTGLLSGPGAPEVVPSPAPQTLLVASEGSDATTRLAAARRASGATHLVVTRLSRLGPVYELDLRLVAGGDAERHEALHGDNPATLAADAVTRVRRWLDAVPAAPDDPATWATADPFVAEAYARGLDAQVHGDAIAAARYFSVCLDRDSGLAWARLGLAIAQGRSGQADDSRVNAQQAAAAGREQGDVALRVGALRQLASLAYHRGALDEASAWLAEALGVLSADAQPLALADVLVTAGSIADERGQVDQARTDYARALALARSSGNRLGEATVLANLASLENAAGDAAAAGRTLRGALDAARSAGDTALEGAVLGNLGATEANQGRLLDAVTLLKQAIALARARGDLDVQMPATAQLIWTLAPFGHDEDSVLLARQMLATAQRAHNRYWEAEAQWALAGLAVRRGDTAAALAAFDQARQGYAAAGMTRSLAPVLADTVGAAAAAGDGARARAAAEAYRALAEGLIGADADVWRARLPLIDAQLRAASGDLIGAQADLTRALDDWHGAGGPVGQAMLFQLAHWQRAADANAALLARQEWAPWLQQHPDAIALRIAALRALGRSTDADAEQVRLDTLLRAPELALDPAWLVAY